MAINVKECEEMIAACKKANVKLYVGYRLHFEPHTQEIIRLAKTSSTVITSRIIARGTLLDHLRWATATLASCSCVVPVSCM